MEQINTLELRDASIYPDAIVLQDILGDSYEAYCELLTMYNENGLEYEWRYYKDGKAWLCKVQKKKKTIVWMSAWKGYMKATIYIQDKYIKELNRLELSEDTKRMILSVKNVGKSKPCMFDIRDTYVLKDFEKVVRYKMLVQ